MRLWSLHPKYLDARGLVALWREGLLAQAVLRGRTSGYSHHPQLDRFRGLPSPAGAIAAYHRAVHAESVERGYRFDALKFGRARGAGGIEVTRGQLVHEWKHLMAKLSIRDPVWRRRLEGVERPRPHPLLRVVPGSIEAWETGAGAARVAPPPTRSGKCSMHSSNGQRCGSQRLRADVSTRMSTPPWFAQGFDPPSRAPQAPGRC